MLSHAEVRAILKKVSFSRAFPWKVRMATEWDVLTKSHYVVLRITVRDRLTGNPMEVVSQDTYRSESEADFLQDLRRHLIEFVTHELDESLLFNGTLLNNPHKDD